MASNADKIASIELEEKTTVINEKTENNGVKNDNDNTVQNNNDSHKKSSRPKHESFNKSLKFTPIKNGVKKEKSFINLKIHKTFLKKLKDQEQIYFASIAPLKSDHIDVNCNVIKDVQLQYCCGLYLPIDSSFTVESILSSEFMSSIQKLCAKPSSRSASIVNNEQKQNDSYVPPTIISQQEVLSSNDDKKSASVDIKQHIIVYVPGQQYSQDEFTAAESIMNECLHFCVDFPYVIIPFLWPSEGPLLSGDDCVDAQKHCANELGAFMRRLWSLFEWIDVIGHGRGCNIVLDAMQMLLRDKHEVIMDSHVICIAPDMESKKFIKHVQTLRDGIRRITLYANTWDWKLYTSKWWNWSSDRAGASILLEKGLDTIDTTDLLSEWFTSNHYYLTNEHVQADISQSLSEFGGLDPKYRNYLIPLAYSSLFSFSTVSNSTYYALTDTALEKPKYNPNKLQSSNQINSNGVNNNTQNNNNNNDNVAAKANSNVSINTNQIDNNHNNNNNDNVDSQVQQ